MRKKGISEITWTYIFLSVTLAAVAFASAPLYNAIDTSSRSYMQVKADELAGIINTVETSPSISFTYSVPLPRTCTIEVNSVFVRITDGRKEATSYIVQTNKTIEKKEIDCAESRYIKITKNDNRMVFE